MGLDQVPAAKRVLTMLQDGTPRNFLVEEPVITIAVPFSAIHPLPPLISARMTNPAIRALMWDDQGLVILVAL